MTEKQDETCENCGKIKNSVEVSVKWDDACHCKAKNHSPQIAQPRKSSTIGKKPYGCGSRHVGKVEGTFNLSKMLLDCMCNMEECGRKVLYEDAVKEFIRRLKVEMSDWAIVDAEHIDSSIDAMEKRIDKLAGDELR